MARKNWLELGTLVQMISNAGGAIRATAAPSPPKDLRSFAESPLEGAIPHVDH